MKKYLDDVGLTYLWSKILYLFNSVVYFINDDGEGGSVYDDTSTATPSADEKPIRWLRDKLFQKFFPVTHLQAVRDDTGTNLETILDDIQNTYYVKPSNGIPGSDLQDKYAGSQTDGGPADKAVSIPFGIVDTTSTSTVFTATINGITELRDGVCVYLRNNKVTSAANWTLNINNLGAKPVYSSMAAASRTSTIFNINYTMLFIYNSTRISEGCWDIFYGYYSDANTVGYEIREYYNGSKKPKTNLYRYLILLSCYDGLLLPVNSVNNSTAVSKTLTTEKFNPLGEVYYYGYTTTVSANANIPSAYLWTMAAYNTCDLRYSFNEGTTLTAGEDIYLVCVPQSDGSAVLHSSPIAKSLPSSENGLIYKRLGKAYDTYRIILEQNKPCYYYKNGAIRLWTNSTDIEIIDLTQ